MFGGIKIWDGHLCSNHVCYQINGDCVNAKDMDGDNNSKIDNKSNVELNLTFKHSFVVAF